jgi:hypothetical protein
METGAIAGKKAKRTHAQRRLAERYGLEITKEQYHLLCELVAHPEARTKPDLMQPIPIDRQFRRKKHSSRWWVNLEFLVGAPLWIRLVFSEKTEKIITVLPPPI